LLNAVGRAVDDGGQDPRLESRGAAMKTPYLAELVRRMRLDNPTVSIKVGENGAATVVRQERDLDHPFVLFVRERDLAAAVTTIGEGCRDALWPDGSVEAAGFNLLLVHLDEVVATRDTSDPLRIADQGLEWPETPRRADSWD
jgi:hypothetical protein